jgi:D-cysteine desulfhydrase family pyridoxal phosphate-dependent enzyme
VGFTPTPLERLPRLTTLLDGPEIWVKRDDQTGIATGGNKVRKLRYLFADAIREHADVVITAGAVQSNHVRQTAAIAAQLGLSCVLILKGKPPQRLLQGNYLLDQILGAKVRWADDRSFAELFAAEEKLLRSQGHIPYVIPFGGSNALGVCGYVSAMAEVYIQAKTEHINFDAMFVASGSGGTQAGLLLGADALGYHGEIVGVSVSESAGSLRNRITQLAIEAADLLHLEYHFSDENVSVNDDYLGGGYGILGDIERHAIHIAGHTEGLLVDPVYTGRCLGGLIDMIQQSTFVKGQRVLFWHTGGTPALFAYGGELLP